VQPVLNGPAPKSDKLLWRMIAGAALTLLVTMLASTVGERWSGLLAVFPVLGSVMAVFSQQTRGPAFTAALLRATATGMYSFSAFCLVSALTLPSLGLSGFIVGVAVSVAMLGVTRKLLARPVPAKNRTSEADATPDKPRWNARHAPWDHRRPGATIPRRFTCHCSARKPSSCCWRRSPLSAPSTPRQPSPRKGLDQQRVDARRQVHLVLPKGFTADPLPAGPTGAKGTMYTNQATKTVVIAAENQIAGGTSVKDNDNEFLDGSLASFIDDQRKALPDFNKLTEKSLTQKSSGLGVRQVDSTATQGGGQTLNTTLLAASGKRMALVQVISGPATKAVTMRW
jgi:uncharacterized membrane protein (GlpM family)